jgi:hypothetical protein
LSLTSFQVFQDKCASREKILKQYRKETQALRDAEKMTFAIGAFIAFLFCFLLGKYPHSHVYTFYVIVFCVLFLLRICIFYSDGRHFFLPDYCYFTNILFVYLILQDPKNEMLFKAVYILITGNFGIAIFWYNNSLIFHKLHTMTSLSVHVVPLVLVYHLRWVTIPYESSQSDRYFCTLTEESY